MKVETDDQFDYWRQFFVASNLDRTRGEGTDKFHGDLLSSATHDGVTFVNLRADSHICTFGNRDSDLILLGYVRSGDLYLRHGHDGATVLNSESGLVLFDCDRPIVTSSLGHDLSYLVLPRAMVAGAMGKDPTPRGTAMRALPVSALAPVLRAHLQALTEHGEHLDAAEVAVAMRAAGSLAIALLAGTRDRPHQDTDALDEAQFASACHHIELNAGNPAFLASHVANALGCSRAHLYRLFARHGRTVAGHLRDVRLQRARVLLEAGLAEPIGMIAFRCGYPDLSTFGKAFRRRFGMMPSECRAIAWTAALAELG